LRQADDVWSDDERKAFIDFIARNPEAGDVIRESGGVRKVRWGRGGTGKQMNKFSKNLIKSLGEACDHAEGRASNARVHVIEVPDVRAIRRKLRMSQMEFAQNYRIPLPTLKNWEQGRRQPDAPAAAYLHAIAKRPREISEALRL